MSNQLLKHVLSGPSIISTSPNPPGKDLKLFQPKKNTVLVSHGRPPWYVIYLCTCPFVSLSRLYFRYGENGNLIGDAFVIGVAGEQTDFHSVFIVQLPIPMIAGGSASGKVDSPSQPRV